MLFRRRLFGGFIDEDIGTRFRIREVDKIAARPLPGYEYLLSRRR